MNVIIVFDSVFGNTQVLADAVAAGLTHSGADVTVLESDFGVAADLGSCDLLVLAAPTHALRLSRSASRARAVARGADPRQARTGVREWLSTIEESMLPGAARPVAAVFDRRFDKAHLWSGSAAKQTARKLRRHGVTVVGRTSFVVRDITGPLRSGEEDRARAWGHAMGDLVITPGPLVPQPRDERLSSRRGTRAHTARKQ